jgi:uncharacterized protein YbjT (DUF2867 family)
MKVLLTGGSGFLAVHVLDQLLKHGYGTKEQRVLI